VTKRNRIVRYLIGHGILYKRSCVKHYDILSHSLIHSPLIFYNPALIQRYLYWSHTVLSFCLIILVYHSYFACHIFYIFTFYWDFVFVHLFVRIFTNVESSLMLFLSIHNLFCHVFRQSRAVRNDAAEFNLTSLPQSPSSLNFLPCQNTYMYIYVHMYTSACAR